MVSYVALHNGTSTGVRRNV